MPARKLDHRARFLGVTNVEPEHVIDRALWLVAQKKGEENRITAAVVHAMEIYEEPYERDILEAWILAKGSAEDINKWLRIPADVYEAYQRLFFDMEVFRDELDMLSWVRTQSKKVDEDDYGMQLKRTAVTTGIDALVWLFGRGESTIDPQRVMEQIMADAHFRGRSNRDHRMTSKEAKAAHEFMNTAFKTAQQLAKRGAPNLNALAIKLLFRNMTIPVEELASKNEEFLH